MYLEKLESLCLSGACKVVSPPNYAVDRDGTHRQKLEESEKLMITEQ
jgi:hypothetical protein